MLTSVFTVGMVYATVKNQIQNCSNELVRLRLDYKEEIQQLRKEVEKHNSMIERTYKLEAKIAVLESRGD